MGGVDGRSGRIYRYHFKGGAFQCEKYRCGAVMRSSIVVHTLLLLLASESHATQCGSFIVFRDELDKSASVTHQGQALHREPITAFDKFNRGEFWIARITLNET